MGSAVRWFFAAAMTLAFALPCSARQRLADDGDSPPLRPSMRAPAPIVPSMIPLTTTGLERGAPVPALAPAMQRQGRNVTMMIAGGAAMLVGPVIDGDTGGVVTVCGGILGLVGLYRYLH